MTPASRLARENLGDVYMLRRYATPLIAYPFCIDNLERATVP